MSTTPRSSLQRRRSRLPAVAAAVGVLLAAGWTFVMRQLVRRADRARVEHSIDRCRALLELMRGATKARAVADAQLLAQDPRLQSTLAMAEIDNATILDILNDLRKLDPDSLFAVLSPDGKVRVTLGAPKLEGQDLSQTQLVQQARQKPGLAATGTWLVDDRVEEVAMVAVRAGDRPVALLAVGNRIDDSQLSALAQAAGVHLALVVNEQPAWADEALPASVWTAPGAARIEVDGAKPQARFVVAPLEVPNPTERLVWAVPALALLFAVLAFWRGGAR